MGSNILNLAVLPKLTSYPESAKCFMSILAFCDFMTALVVFVNFPSTYVNRLLIGDGLCKLLGFSFFFFGGSSSTVLLLMNIDRYIAISRPFLHQRYMNNRNIGILCTTFLLLWFVFIQLCVTKETFFDNIAYDLVYRICITQLQTLEGIYPTLLSVFLYLQIIVLIFIYVRIWRVSREQSRRMNAVVPAIPSGTENGAITNNISGGRDKISEAKATRTTLLVTGVFIISYAPYSTSVALKLGGVAVPPPLDATTALLAICNTWWNTVVYSIYNRSFRERILRLFCSRN